MRPLRLLTTLTLRFCGVLSVYRLSFSLFLPVLEQQIDDLLLFL